VVLLGGRADPPLQQVGPPHIHCRLLVCLPSLRKHAAVVPITLTGTLFVST
jgi:hypothetical protein